MIYFKRQQLIVLIILVLVNGISLLSGALNWLNQFFIVGSLFFIAGLIYREKWLLNRFLYGILLLLPFTGIYTTFVLIKGFSHVYPIGFIPLLTLPAGLFLNQTEHKKSPPFYILVTFVFSVIAFGAYVGMPNWLSYVFNKPVAGIQADRRNVSELAFINTDGSEVRLGDFEGKIVILDFWSTSCGICYKKFPELEKLYETYKHNDSIRIFAVNLIHKDQTIEQMKNKAEELGYTFPNLLTTFEERNRTTKVLQFNAVPTLVILDKDGSIYYRGSLETSDRVFVNNTYKIIDKLLKKQQ